MITESLSLASWTLPIERIMLSAQGNLQNLLAAYFNSDIIIRVLEHTLLSSEASILEIIQSIISPQTWQLHNAIFKLTETPENFMVIQRNIELKVAFDDSTACRCDSLCFLKMENYNKDEISSTFVSGKLGIGQYYKRRRTVPEFSLLEYGRGEHVLPLNTPPHASSLYRIYTLEDTTMMCLIKETFMTSFK